MGGAILTVDDGARVARQTILGLIGKVGDDLPGVRLADIPLRLDPALRTMEASGEVTISWVRDVDDPGTWLHYVRLTDRN